MLYCIKVLKRLSSKALIYHEGDIMKTSKKIIAILTAIIVLTCTFAACGGNENGGTTADVYKVGICQLTEHVALDAATEGFKHS